MNQKTGFSLLQPFGMDIEYRRIPDHVMHDLGLDTFFQEISSDGKERRLVANVLSQISGNPNVAVYRQQIFGDIFRLPELRKTMLELFDKIQFMWDFSTMHKLGYDAEELNREMDGAGAASLVMLTDEGKRSFKVALAKPEGSSYAKDIAEKYGVTYDMLIGNS